MSESNAGAGEDMSSAREEQVQTGGTPATEDPAGSSSANGATAGGNGSAEAQGVPTDAGSAATNPGGALVQPVGRAAGATRAASSDAAQAVEDAHAASSEGVSEVDGDEDSAADSEGTQDFSDDEDEGKEGYKKGGYHPVSLPHHPSPIRAPMLLGAMRSQISACGRFGLVPRVFPPCWHVPSCLQNALGR